MSKFIFALFLIFSSSTSAADLWRTSDTYREVTFQILNVIDWGQTRYVAQHPDQYKENDMGRGGSAWLIGEHPSTTNVDRLMIATAILHPIISYYLPHNWREAFQYVTIGMKIDNTVGNFHAGVKFDF